MRSRWLSRGGVATAAGWILVALGLLFFFTALGEASQLTVDVTRTALPAVEPSASLLWLLAGFSVATLCGGGLLIGFARGERAREEDRSLDPLSYAPFHYPVVKVLPALTVALVALIVAGLLIVPVEHSFHAEFAVSTCVSGSPGSPYNVSLPSGAILTYHWRSSNGKPVDELLAPDGPRVNSSTIPASSLFFDSSFGYSGFTSDGGPVTFWACDLVAFDAAGQSVVIDGTYYQWIL